MNDLHDLIKTCELCVQNDSVNILGDNSNVLVAYNKTNNKVLFMISAEHGFYEFACRGYCISETGPRNVLVDLYTATAKKYYEQTINFLNNQIKLKEH